MSGPFLYTTPGVVYALARALQGQNWEGGLNMAQNLYPGQIALEKGGVYTNTFRICKPGYWIHYSDSDPPSDKKCPFGADGGSDQASSGGQTITWWMILLIVLGFLLLIYGGMRYGVGPFG